MIKMKVVKVGWDDENYLVPIILLDRNTRNKLTIGKQSMVLVSVTDTTKIPAGVHVQFKTLLGKGATVNSLLATLLKLKEGDEITIEKVDTSRNIADIAGGRIENN